MPSSEVTEWSKSLRVGCAGGMCSGRGLGWLIESCCQVLLWGMTRNVTEVTILHPTSRSITTQLQRSTSLRSCDPFTAEPHARKSFTDNSDPVAESSRWPHAPQNLASAALQAFIPLTYS